MAPAREAVLQEWTARFGHGGRLMHFQCRGCSHCEQTGFIGRAGVHELLTVSRDLRRLIQTGSHMEEIQKMALHDGMRTLRQDGIEKVLAGVTTIEEVRATSNV
jgi:type II secretory ATPase GspE/PulE/Tfp pilus assembly ATPase PilB-like protein